MYRILIGYDTSGEPIYKWHCDCEKCLTSTSPCQRAKKEANSDEDKDTALYASLRR